MESVDANITRMDITPTVTAGLTVLAASEQIGATPQVFQAGAGAAEALGSSISSLEQILEAVVKVVDSISEVVVIEALNVHDVKFDLFWLSDASTIEGFMGGAFVLIQG